MTSHFGPSVKSIHDTMLDIDTWFNAQPLYSFIDHAGKYAERPMTEEEMTALNRISQLYDLTTLSRPVPLTEWKLDMLAGCCNA